MHIFLRQVRISAFLNDLIGGFRMLNLKNDSLRKKFDSLKYDLKKVEVSLRGMTFSSPRNNDLHFILSR